VALLLREQRARDLPSGVGDDRRHPLQTGRTGVRRQRQGGNRAVDAAECNAHTSDAARSLLTLERDAPTLSDAVELLVQCDVIADGALGARHELLAVQRVDAFGLEPREDGLAGR